MKTIWIIYICIKNVNSLYMWNKRKRNWRVSSAGVAIRSYLDQLPNNTCTVISCIFAPCHHSCSGQTCSVTKELIFTALKAGTVNRAESIKECRNKCRLFFSPVPTAASMATSNHPTEATKKKFLAGRGGIGVSSVEDWVNSAPAGCWLAAEKMAAEGIFRPVSENSPPFVMFRDH